MRFLVLVCLFNFIWFNPAQAQLPMGSVLIFSNGDVEKLIAYQGANSLWENGKKIRYLRSSNPAIPNLARTVFADPEGGYYLKLTKGNPDSLLTGRQGLSSSFTYQRHYDDGRISQRNWQCTFDGTVSAQVIKQTTTVQRFTCIRYTLSRKTGEQIIRERRITDYDPELGVVINADVRRGKKGQKNRSRYLVQILPPEQATASKIQRTLYRMFN